MRQTKKIPRVQFCVIAVAGLGLGLIGCGSADSGATTIPDGGVATVQMHAPILLDDTAGPCTEAHSVCLTVTMPDTIPGAPTHLAVGYYMMVPVKTPAAARGVLQAPALVAGQTFRLKVEDGGLTGPYYPVVLVYMPGGGDIIAVDNLDYTAEATQTYDLTTTPLNVAETLKLVYGI